jgi:hypothetical protein
MEALYQQGISYFTLNYRLIYLQHDPRAQGICQAMALEHHEDKMDDFRKRPLYQKLYLSEELRKSLDYGGDIKQMYSISSGVTTTALDFNALATLAEPRARGSQSHSQSRRRDVSSGQGTQRASE